MPRKSENEDEVQGRGFWTFSRILLVAIFIAGFVAGIYVSQEYSTTGFLSLSGSDYNALAHENQRLDARNEELFKCLLENDIEPSACK